MNTPPSSHTGLSGPSDGISPLLSIAIATHNRQQYAMHTIRSILKIRSKDLELIIQDSSDNQTLPSLLGALADDSRLKYAHRSGPVSMTENYNIAVSRCSGRYVCVIGDDDGINPDILAVTQWASQNGVDAISQSPTAVYFWPDYRLRWLGDRYAGKLFIRKFPLTLQSFDSYTAITNCLAAGCLSAIGLPKVYNGLVKRTLLESVKNTAGAYFGGVSPDIFGSLAVGLLTNTVLVVHFPLIITGCCGASNTCLYAKGRHVGSLAVPQLAAFKHLSWPRVVPQFYSVETVWAQSALAALTQMGRQDLLRVVNFSRLYAKCFWFHPRYCRDIVRSIACLMTTDNRTPLRETWKLVCSLLVVGSQRLANVFLRGRNLIYRSVTGKAAWRATVIAGLPGIESATDALIADLVSENHSVAQLLTRTTGFSAP